MSYSMRNLGQAIKKVRREKGLTQKDLAKKMSKKTTVISRIESGLLGDTSLDFLTDIAKVLEVSPSFFVAAAFNRKIELKSGDQLLKLKKELDENPEMKNMADKLLTELSLWLKFKGF